MTNIRTQREERAEANRVPIFGIIRSAFTAVRGWWRRRVAEDVRDNGPRKFDAPKPVRRKP